MSLSVGVAVPCKNEVATLEICLRALRKQQPPVARIVVVDNGSTDGSQAVARRLADEVVELPGASISRLRNRGAAALPDMDVIGFVDADVVVGASWLPAGLHALESGADLVGSRSLANEDASWVAARWAEVERHRAHAGSLLWSQHLLVKAPVFADLAGFDESMRTGEDADLSARARERGHAVELVPDMTAAHHGFPATLRRFVKREFWHTSTPGWYERMAPGSQRLVDLTAGWLALGAAATAGSAVTRRGAPVAGWLAASAVGVAGLGRVAGGSLRHSVADGTLLALWSAVRVVRLARETLSNSTGARP